MLQHRRRPAGAGQNGDLQQTGIDIGQSVQGGLKAPLGHVEVYRDPEEDCYRQAYVLETGTLASSLLPEAVIDIAGLF